MLKINLKKPKLRLKILAIAVLCVGLLAGMVSPTQATGLALDKKVTKKQTSAASSITAPTFSTSVGNQLFLAFVAVDGPGGTGTQTISSVTGGGLTWTLRKRANGPGSGTAEIWQAIATTPKSNVAVKATMSKTSYVGQLTVATFTGADLSQNGAVVGASAKNGAAAISLTTTRQNSWVWGVGNDWDRAVARTLGANQTMVDETINTGVGDTQWVQRQNATTPLAGTLVSLNTTAPTNDRWNMVAIEIPNANADTTAPVAPVVVNPGNNTSGNNATPTFSGTGEVGATIRLAVDSTPAVTTSVDGAGNWTYTPSAPLSDGTHTVRATQVDAAGNASPASDTTTFTIDTTAPRVTVNQKEGQADPTPVNSAAFTAVFSEAMSANTVEASDFTVSGTSGSISSLSQLNATTWELVVSGMTAGDTAAVSLSANVATDLLGNGNTASSSTDNTVTFDNTIVAAPAIASPANNTRLTSLAVVTGSGIDGMTITLKADGNVMECKEGVVTIANGAWTCTLAAPLTDGVRVLTAQQTNTEGHVSSVSGAVSIMIDTARPTVTVDQKDTQVDPSPVNTAAYTVVFSEEITASSLTKEDFTVSGTAGTVTSLTQSSPTTWEVMITGMSSGDTAILSLDADKVVDLVGNTNQSSTSIDNSVRYEAPTSIIGWKLTAANTGLAPHGLSCDMLPEYTGPAKVPAGTTISEKKITKSLVLAQGDVVIERSCFMPTSSETTMVQTYDNDYCDDNGCLPPSDKPSVIRDSEFNGSRLDPPVDPKNINPRDPNNTYNRAQVTAFKGIANLQRNYVHDLGSGLGILNSGMKLDVLVEQNYVTNMVSWGDGNERGSNHSEAFTIRDFDGTQNTARQAVVRNNRFNTDGGNETGAAFFQAMSNINNVTFEGNSLEGFGYQLQLAVWAWASPGTHYSNMKAINNRFSGGGYGASYTEGPGWSVWRDNYYSNPAVANNQGGPVVQ